MMGRLPAVIEDHWELHISRRPSDNLAPHIRRFILALVYAHPNPLYEREAEDIIVAQWGSVHRLRYDEIHTFVRARLEKTGYRLQPTPSRALKQAVENYMNGIPLAILPCKTCGEFSRTAHGRVAYLGRCHRYQCRIYSNHQCPHGGPEHE